MSQSSIVYTIRLDPEKYEIDAKVVEAIERGRRENMSVREVITNYVLQSIDADFQNITRTNSITEAVLIKHLEKYQKQMMSEIRSGNFTFGVTGVTPEAIETDEDRHTDAEANIAAMWKRRRQQ